MDIDKLAQHTTLFLDRFQAMSKAHEVSDTLCANDPRKKLPSDFVQSVNSFRVRIDALIQGLTALSSTLKTVSGTAHAVDPATVADLNQRYLSLRSDGETLTDDCDVITKRHKEVLPNGVWIG